MSSSTKELSKFEKEKQKLIQEKCQGLLNEMLRDDDNKYCVDCDAKGPRWASWNLGIFLCIRCAGIHRNLGVHISRVKSVNLDSWTPEQVVTMQQMGNSRARAVYEANLPDNFRRPQTDVALENFIRAKYEHTKYIAQEWVKPAPPRVDWNAEIEEQIRRKKDKKNVEAAAAALPRLGGMSKHSQIKTSNNHPKPSSHPPPLGKIEVPKPVEVQAPAAAAQQQAPTQPTSASDDLLGLTTDTPTLSDPFASPVKSTNTPLAATTTTATSSTSDDLGGVFTAPDANSQQKMTKESILSLYGSLGGGSGGGGGNNGFAGGGGGMVPPPAGNNPFATSMGQFGGGGTSMNNPFPTQPQPQGMFSADLIGNNGFGGGALGMGGGSQMPSSNVAQLQQGLFSLNLTSTTQSTSQSQSTPHTQNSNLIFNNTATPSSTNLNMLTMNNAAPGNFFATPPPQSAVGGGGASLPNMMMPPSQAQQQQQHQFLQQQQTQQNQLFNQFQQAPPMGLFQNGGSMSGLGSLGGTTAGTGSAANNTNHVNVDLLWK